MALPLMDVKTHYDPYCEYPTSLKLAFDDHTVQEYVLVNKTDYLYRQISTDINSIKTGYPMRRRNRRNR